MKRQIIYILTLCWLLSFSANAQKTFQFGENAKFESANAVLTLPKNKGFILAGYQDNDAYIVKTGLNGIVSASPLVISNAVVNAIVLIDTTSCYLVGQEGNKAMVRKYNFVTNTYGAIELTDDNNSAFLAAAKTSNGFLFGGYKTIVAPITIPILGKIGNATLPVWDSTKVLTYPESMITGITTTADNAVWICGNYNSENAAFVWNVDLNKIVKFPNLSATKRVSAFISPAPNNDIYVGINDKTSSINSKTRIVHLDKNAILLQEKSLHPGELTDGVFHNGKLYYTGNANNQAFITTMSNDLTLISTQMYGDAPENTAYGIDTTQNGLIIAGYTGDLNFNQNMLMTLTEFKTKTVYSVKGKVFSTIDCANTLTQNPLDKWTIVGKSNLTGKENIAISNENGEYTMICDTSGNYVFTAKPVVGWQTCNPIVGLVDATGLVNTMGNLFVKDSTQKEPYLTLDIAPIYLAANEDITYYGEARNATSYPVQNVKVSAQFAPELKHVSASVPSTTPAADLLLLDLGTMKPFEVKKFQFKRRINTPLPDPKRSYWMDAEITPYKTSFKGPRYHVTGICTGTTVKFTMTNTGTDTLQSDFNRRYDIVIDDLILRNSLPYKNLKPNESQTFEFSTNLEKPIAGNATFTMIVHQGNSKYPNVYGNQTGGKVEACGLPNFSYNSMSNITDLDDDPTRVYYADTLVKNINVSKLNSFPKGTILNNKNIVLDSITTFEIYDVIKNTNANTQNTLYIKHQLSSPFELKNIVPGVSSLGDYEMKIDKDNTLLLVFNDINLAPNELGMVAFRLKIPLKNNTDSVFSNQASARFSATGDYQQTGTISQIVNPTGGLKLGGIATLVSIKMVTEDPLLDILLAPNPFQHEVLITIPEILLHQGDLDLNIYDLHGRLLQSQAIPQTTVLFDATALQAGFYVCEIKQNGKIVAREKMVKR